MRKIVSLSDMKTYLGVVGTGDDTFLTSQIELITEAMELYCRRIFNATDFIQTFYNDRCALKDSLELFYFPIISVSGIEEDGIELPSQYYYFHKPTGLILMSTSRYFFGGQGNTVVSFRAGYEDADMPPTLKQIVYDLVGERYNKKKSGVNLSFGSDVQRVSIPGAISIDFDYSLNNNDRKNAFGNILGSQLNVLDYFRSERAIIGGSKVSFIEEA